MHQQLDNLDKVKQAFQKWRDSRSKQGRIPEYLWEMVGLIRDEYPDHMISRYVFVSALK